MPFFNSNALRQAFAISLLSVSFLSPLLSSQLQAAPVSAQEFQNLLKEERTWAGLQSKSLTVGDVTWAYSEGGRTDKPTLLLIHGLAGSRDNWNRVARYLTPDYHVIIPDLPAGGDTKAPADFDLSVPNLTEQLRRFAEAAKITDNLHVVGHSLGGAIAMLYVAQYPLDTKSLFLIDSAGVFKTGTTPYLKDPTHLRQMIVSKTGDFDQVLKQVMQNPPFLPQAYKDAQEKMMIAQAPQTTRMIEQLITLNKAYTPESFALLARTIDVPTLILWGKDDKIINVEVAAELKATLKNAQPPIILNNVGHVPILEAEQLVIQQYLPFLSKVQSSSTTH